MNHIRAIVHDWDDVITNSFEIYSQFYFDAARIFDLETPKIENIRKYWGNTIAVIAQGQWPHLSKEEAERLVHETVHCKERERTSHRVSVFPRVKETIEKLSKKYTLGILSSGRSDAIKGIYKMHIKPEGYYHKFILDATDTPVHKPDPNVFDTVFELLEPYGIAENETVYVGDHIYDWLAARDRGIDFIAITTGVKTKDDFLKHGLEEQYIYKNFSDLLDIFNA